MRRPLTAALLLGAALAALAALTAPALAQTRTVTDAPTLEEGGADRARVLSEIDAAFDKWQADAHVPGLVYGVVLDGRLIHVRASGVKSPGGQPVASDTLFRIASMSKAFTALAILKLRDEGKLSLDAPAETYVPELARLAYPTADSPRIRVRDLLSHLGGFVTDDPWGDRQQVMTEAEFTALLEGGLPFTRAPQTAFEYSNTGYALLGRIITNASGRPYNDYIEQEIMRPLGMTSTGYDVFASDQTRSALGYRWENDAWSREPDMVHGVYGAMGGVQTSADDYAKWIAFLLSAWPARDDPDTGPVRRATVREMAQGLNFVSGRNRTLADGRPCTVATAYGKGLITGNDCEIGVYLTHSGGYPGYGSNMILAPERGLGVFAFANRTYAGPGGPTFDAAAKLAVTGLAPARTLPLSPALTATYADLGRIWTAGDVSVAEDRLAMNFLMDRSVENWRTVLEKLKADSGDCAHEAPPTATGALSANFSWTCDNGRIEGRLLLAPTTPVTLQAINFRFVPASPPATP